MTASHGVVQCVPSSRGYGVRVRPGCEESVESYVPSCLSGEMYRTEAIVVLSFQISTVARKQSDKIGLTDSREASVVWVLHGRCERVDQRMRR